MATQKSGRLAGRHGSDMYALMDGVVVRELLGQQLPVTSRPAGGGWVCRAGDDAHRLSIDAMTTDAAV